MEPTEDYIRAMTLALYALSTLFAFCVVVVGNISQNQHSEAYQLAVLYGFWAMASTSLVCACYRHAETIPKFILKCWYYLVCTAVMLTFFRSLGTIDPDNIHLWVPVSFNLGIFFSQGLSALHSLATARVVNWLMDWTSSNNDPSENLDEELGHTLIERATESSNGIGSTPNERVSQ